MAFVRRIIPNVGVQTIGNATLVAGSVVEANAMIGHNANPRVTISRKTVGGGTPGILAYSAGAADLTITSSEATDVPNVDYVIDS